MPTLIHGRAHMRRPRLSGMGDVNSSLAAVSDYTPYLFAGGLALLLVLTLMRTGKPRKKRVRAPISLDWSRAVLLGGGALATGYFVAKSGVA